jgi:signal transduction histidine kinase/CheY-like chemotaxis protein
MCWLVVIASSIICFAPFYSSRLNSRNDGHMIGYYVHDILQSKQYLLALAASISLAIPMAVDIVLDSCSVYSCSDQSEKVHWLTRCLFLAALTVPNTVLYAVDFGEEWSLSGYLSLSAFKFIASLGSMFAYLAQDQQQINAGPYSTAALACSAVSQLLYIFSYYTDATDDNGGNAMKILSAIFIAFSFAITTNLFYRWVKHCLDKDVRIEPEIICVLVYFFAAILLLFVTSIFFYQTEKLYTQGFTYVTLMLYFLMGVLVIVTKLPGRVARMRLEKSSRLMEERQAFIRYISHEIRTPLNTVFLGMTYAKSELEELAPLSPDQVEPIIETVDDMAGSCQTALSILNDLLTFDKIESGKMTLDLDDANCWSFFRDTVKPFVVQARQKSVAISCSPNNARGEGGTLWTEKYFVRVDQHKMSQVVRNLVSNAVKFTPEGGDVRIIVRRLTAEEKAAHNEEATEENPKDVATVAPDPTANEEMMRLEVIDSGAGISKENQKKLFGQYVQFNAGKLQKGNGSGLGLWISRGIVELHGGFIGAYSEGEGKGCTFFIDIPLHLKEGMTPSAPDETGGPDQEAMGAFSFDPSKSSRIARGVSIRRPAAPLVAMKHRGSFAKKHSQMFDTSQLDPVAAQQYARGDLSAKQLTAMLKRGLSARPTEGFPKFGRASEGNLMLPSLTGAVGSQPQMPSRRNLNGNDGNNNNNIMLGRISEVQSPSAANISRNVSSGGVSRMQSIMGFGSTSGMNTAAAGLRADQQSPGQGIGTRLPSARGAGGSSGSHGNNAASGMYPIASLMNMLSRVSSKQLFGRTQQQQQQQFGSGKFGVIAGAGGNMESVPEQERRRSVVNSEGTNAQTKYSFRIVPLVRAQTDRGHQGPGGPRRVSVDLLRLARESIKGVGAGVGAAAGAGSHSGKTSVRLLPLGRGSDGLSAGRIAGGGGQEMLLGPTGRAILEPELASVRVTAAGQAGGHNPNYLQNQDAVSAQQLGRHAADTNPTGTMTEVGVHIQGKPTRVGSGGSLSSALDDAISGAANGTAMGSTIAQKLSKPITSKTPTRVPTSGTSFMDSSIPTAPEPTGNGAQSDSNGATISEGQDAERKEPEPVSVPTNGAMNSSASPSGKRRGTVKTPNGGLPTMNFLIVDDSAPNRKICARVLTRQGHTVTEAVDGDDCLRVVESAEAAGRQFDIILMDDNMPNLSGPQTSKILRECGYAGMICGVTGNTLPQDVENFMRHGASVVLPKPLDLTELQRQIPLFLGSPQPQSQPNVAAPAPEASGLNINIGVGIGNDPAASPRQR